MRTLSVVLFGLLLMILKTESTWKNIDCFQRESQTVCITVDHNATELTNAEAVAECGRRHQNGRLGAGFNSRIIDRSLRTERDGVYWFGSRLRQLHQWTWIGGSTDVSWISIHGSNSPRYVKLTVTDSGYQVELNRASDSRTTELALCQACASERVDCYYVGAASGWHGARNWCLTRGGDLAFLSNSTYQALRQRRVLLPGNTYYVGLRNAIFEWQGTSDEVKYTDWDRNDYLHSVEAFGGCVLFSSTRHRWLIFQSAEFRSANCSESHRFICEYVMERSPTTTADTATSVIPNVLFKVEDETFDETCPHTVSHLDIGLVVLSTSLFALLVCIAGHRLYDHLMKQKRTAQPTERYEQIAVSNNRTAADNTLMYEPIRVLDNAVYANVSPEEKCSTTEDAACMKAN